PRDRSGLIIRPGGPISIGATRGCSAGPPLASLLPHPGAAAGERTIPKQGATPVAEKTLKVGMVGCGDIALKNYLPGTAALMPVVEMVAACDTVESHAEYAAEHFGIPNAYTRIEDLPDDPEVQAVGRPTPCPRHFPLAPKALKPATHAPAPKRRPRTWPAPAQRTHDGSSQ